MCDYFKRLVVYCDGRRRIRSTPRKGLPKLSISWFTGAGVLMLGRGQCKSWQWKCIIFHSINIQHIVCSGIEGLWCCFPKPLLNFIHSMTGLSLCKYEPFWQEVGVESLIIRWPLRPVGLALEKLSWFKAGKMYEDSEYLCVIILKGW